jgi:hypothetical protein
MAGRRKVGHTNHTPEDSPPLVLHADFVAVPVFVDCERVREKEGEKAKDDCCLSLR